MARGPKTRGASFVQLRLTAAGWAVLGIALLVGVATARSQASLLFVLFGGMLGALYISAMMARRMAGSMRVHRDVPSRAWQNQTVHLGYVLRNASRRGCLSMNVTEHAPQGLQSAVGHCVHLAGRNTFRAGARFAARQRGRIRLTGIRVWTTFPFGLVRALRTLWEPAELVVWPARGQLRSQLLQHGAAEISTAAPSQRTGGEDEFFGLREYRPGDNPRWIHWRRSATRPAPVVREMTHPFPDVLWVVVDTCCRGKEPADLQRREQRLRLAATLIDYAFQRGFRVALAAACGQCVQVHRPQAGRAQRIKLLDCLAEVGPETGSIEATILQLPHAAMPQAQAVLIVDRQEELNTQVVMALRAATRHLTIVSSEQMDEVFADNPLAAGEEA